MIVINRLPCVKQSLDIAVLLAIVLAVALPFAGIISGCAGTSQRGSGSQAAGAAAVRIVDLRCLGDGSVVAAAVAGTHGLLFQSDDRGLTWQVGYSHGVLEGVVPEFWDDPRQPGSGPKLLYVRKHDDVTSLSAAAIGRALLLQDDEWAGPDQWLVSADHGHSWTPANSPVPYLKHQAMFPLSHDTKRLDDSGAIGFLAIEPVNFLKAATLRKQSLLELVVSHDNGGHWTRIEVPGYMRAYNWFADGHGRVVVFGKPSTDTTEGLAVSVSSNGGAWSMRFSDDDFDANTFVARGHADGPIVVAGTGGKHPGRQFRLITSPDGGMTWTPQRWVPGGLHDIAQLGPNRFGLLRVQNHHLQSLLSADGGANWAPSVAIDASADTGQYNGALLHTQGGIVIAYFGRLTAARTTDGGETWTRVDLGLSAASASPTTSCTNGHGVVALGGADGSITTSGDDGLTWRPASLTEAAPVSKLPGGGY